ncbi:MAG: Trk system potassium transporter TrkA [bacterium]
MKIIILGAGRVGSSLAQHLSGEANDITLVDQDAAVLREIRDKLDLRTIEGQGSHPDVLRQAGAEDADMLVAVTNSDETNMIACQVAYTLFHTPTKIARVRTGSYLSYEELFSNQALPVDVRISPEQLVTEELLRLIRNPGSLQVIKFAHGRLHMAVVRVEMPGAAVGHTLKDLTRSLPDVSMRIAAIFRRGVGVEPTPELILEDGDEVFFFAEKRHIKTITAELREVEQKNKRVIIAGGGNIGTRLAKALESKHRVKIIERNRIHGRELAEVLGKAIVIRGDAADEELLIEENIETTDLFIALTNDDEANILSAMLAKRLGAKKVISLINRPSYAQLVESAIIDVAISPQQVTMGALLTKVRRGDVVGVHSLRRGTAEVIEAIAHGDRRTSKVIGKEIGKIKMPSGCRLVALVRGDTVIFTHNDTVIEAGDHVIVFVTDKRRIPDIEKLFVPAVTFI